jgi:hypothetical protein
MCGVELLGNNFFENSEKTAWFIEKWTKFTKLYTLKTFNEKVKIENVCWE